MNNDIRVLEELGLSEVSRRTHIEVEYLQWMVNKEFDKLNRVNTLGFIKILTREYQLDLTNWTNEFDAYWNEFKKDYNQKEVYFAHKNESNVSIESSKKKKMPIFPILVVLVLGYLAWHFNIVHYLNLNNEAKNKEQVSKYSNIAVIEEAEENLDILKKEENESVALIAYDLNVSQDEDLNETNISEENNNFVDKDNLSLINETDNNETNDSNNSSPTNNSLVSEENPSNDLLVDDLDKKERLELNGTIYPGIKIWVGILYLDKGRKKSLLTNNTINLDLSKEQLLVTGHGILTLGADGNKTQKFNSQNRLRFYIKDGKMRQIDKEEYDKISKGKKAW